MCLLELDKILSNSKISCRKQRICTHNEGLSWTKIKSKHSYPLVLAVRRTFHRAAHAVESLHEGSEVSSGMRAVLENVIDGGPQTVPCLRWAAPRAACLESVGLGRSRGPALASLIDIR